MASDDEEKLLRILEAHGQQFLESFGSFVANPKRKESPVPDRASPKRRKPNEAEDFDSEEEWSGFTSPDDELDEFDSSNDEDNANQGDIDERNQRGASVVVFSEGNHAGKSSDDARRKAQMKAFMSSKVTKLTQDAISAAKKDKDEDTDENDLTNAQNDALLHRLVHTRILAGSLDSELDLTPAQRRKALAGRVIEAAGKAKLGKGESAVRLAERNKAAKQVRIGLEAKRKERHQKQLEEAKNMGNYHPVLKKLYSTDISEKSQNRKRERGLKMGVGSFNGGILRLSKDEIASASGSKRGGQQSARKKGGSRRPSSAR